MSRSVFDLRLADPTLGSLDVLQWSGEEGISKLFRFDVDVFATDQTGDIATAWTWRISWIEMSPAVCHSPGSIAWA